MATSNDLKNARQRLKAAQAASAKFELEHRGVKLSAEEEAQQLRLLRIELVATVEVTDLKISLNEYHDPQK